MADTLNHKFAKEEIKFPIFPSEFEERKEKSATFQALMSEECLEQVLHHFHPIL